MALDGRPKSYVDMNIDLTIPRPPEEAPEQHSVGRAGLEPATNGL
jgi:hypothetical protein